MPISHRLLAALVTVAPVAFMLWAFAADAIPSWWMIPLAAFGSALVVPAQNLKQLLVALGLGVVFLFAVIATLGEEWDAAWINGLFAVAAAVWLFREARPDAAYE